MAFAENRARLTALLHKCSISCRAADADSVPSARRGRSELRAVGEGSRRAPRLSTLAWRSGASDRYSSPKAVEQRELTPAEPLASRRREPRLPHLPEVRHRFAGQLAHP